ncbi:MAG: hypothetical protein GY800_05755 [Planctomycetes bacterium]|nr:hypothetical protein [Planctomycetota bacterium]
MFSISMRIFVFMALLLTGLIGGHTLQSASTQSSTVAYGQGLDDLLEGLGGEEGPSEEVPAETREGAAGEKKKPYEFDGDVFIVDRDPKTTHRVIKVISANTILLDNGEMVKMIGVELTEEDGVRAFRMVKGLLEGKEVRLKFHRRNRDIDGNLLAIVYKGDLNVNELLEEKFFLNTEIDPSFSYSPAYLDKVFPDRKKPMDFYELTIKEEQPPVEKHAVLTLKGREVPVKGVLLKETKDFLLIKSMFNGLQRFRKKDIEKISFE